MLSRYCLIIRNNIGGYYVPDGEGIKHTIISFEPLFYREDMRGLTDAKIGKKLGLDTQTVKAIAAEYFPAKE